MKELTLSQHQEILKAASAARVASGGSPIEPLGRIVATQKDRKIDPWEHFYFRGVNDALYHRAKELAEATIQISRGTRKTLVMSENSEQIGKVGEMVTDEFFQYYFGAPLDADAAEKQENPPLHPWKPRCRTLNARGGDVTDFELYGLRLDVKTRQLHTDATIAPSFDLRVPRHEINKRQDIYLLAGFCPTSSYAYVIGWCAFEELQAKELNTQVKFPAKCVPIAELYRPDTLADYARARADYLGRGG